MTFKNIFLYEIKEQMKSKVFYGFIIVLLIVTLVDYNNGNKRLKPLEKNDYYGFTNSTAEEDILYRGYELLSMTYHDQKIIRYIPLGIYKDLSITQINELGDFIEKMAPGKDFLAVNRDDFKVDIITMFNFMEHLDEDVGGKTLFANKEYFYTKEMTYEEALDERIKIKKQDDFTRSYARLFSDYNSVYAGLFSIFIIAFSTFRDSRTGQKELYYTAGTKSIPYVAGKFCGLLISIMSVFLLLALAETIIFFVQSIKYAESVDIFAFIRTTLLWITPTVMFYISFSLLIYVIFNRFLLTICSQLAISLYMISSTPLSGDYGLSRLLIRFNQLTPYENFEPFAHIILINRLFYMGLSLVLLSLVSYIWALNKKQTLKILDSKIESL